jgi:integrase
MAESEHPSLFSCEQHSLNVDSVFRGRQALIPSLTAPLDDRCPQRMMGVTVAPHDLRRTFAKLAHNGGSPIAQIQLSLGHSSIQTTERYLGVNQDLRSAPTDVLGLRL